MSCKMAIRLLSKGRFTIDKVIRVLHECCMVSNEEIRHLDERGLYKKVLELLFSVPEYELRKYGYVEMKDLLYCKLGRVSAYFRYSLALNEK